MIIKLATTNAKIMIIIAIKAILLLIIFHRVVILKAQSDGNVLPLDNAPNQYWYTGVIDIGFIMLIGTNYEAGLHEDNYGNQIQALLLSNQGDTVCCNLRKLKTSLS